MKNKSPDLWLFFYLFSRCILLLSALSLTGIFLGQIISFLKNGINISLSKEDIFFVVKVGCGVGGFLGAGLCIIAKLDFYFKNKSSEHIERSAQDLTGKVKKRDKKVMSNNKTRLLLLLVTSWIVGLFIILVGGRLLISLASYFLVDDFDFDLNDLIKGAKIAIGCGFIIGSGQCLMSKEKPNLPTNPK